MDMLFDFWQVVHNLHQKVDFLFSAKAKSSFLYFPLLQRISLVLDFSKTFNAIFLVSRRSFLGRLDVSIMVTENKSQSTNQKTLEQFECASFKWDYFTGTFALEVISENN